MWHHMLPGAVGRVLVHEEDGQKRVQFDLKGGLCWLGQVHMSRSETCPPTVGGTACVQLAVDESMTWGGASNCRSVSTCTNDSTSVLCTGIVYDARLAQLPGTLCVVNIGQTEAKVEAVMHSFLQLVRSDADNSEVRTLKSLRLCEKRLPISSGGHSLPLGLLRLTPRPHGATVTTALQGAARDELHLGSCVVNSL
jgi:hypothetical protein